MVLHKHGFIHRDLSPGNVIVIDGIAKISDLEFAKAHLAKDLEMLTRPGEPGHYTRDTLAVYFFSLAAADSRFMSWIGDPGFCGS